MSGPPPSNFATLPTAGDVIDGKYVLEALLGKGGMGAVYSARHLKLGHKVAIKVMLADAANHEAASRFVNEGRAAANIQNEHVVRVSDVDEENGYAYMVLELLEGEDLSQVLDRERRLAPNVAVAYVLQALDGVRQAHAVGIVHRDLKPSNLFLAKRQDGTTVIKVLDFGISKAGANNPLGQAPGALTSTKAMLGSPLYMSPEQLRSSKSVDARADIWAMGVILYELITGTLPFMGDNLGELFAQILEVEAPPLRTRAPEASPQLEAIVARCLQRRPEHRFQNVAELEHELAPLAAGPSASPFAASALLAPLHPRTAMMSTPQFAQAQAARASAGYGTPPGAPMAQHFAQSPHAGAPFPLQVGSVTGSGAHVPVVKGTAPLGASTPQPYRQNDAAWQSTGSTPRGPNTMVMILGGLAFLAVVGVGLAGYSSYSKKHHGSSGGGGGEPTSSSAEVLPPSLPPTTLTIPTVTTPTEAGSTVAVPAAVSAGPAAATSAAAAVSALAPRPHHPPPAAAVRVDLPPPKPDPDPPPPPKPPPPAPTRVSPQQNSR